MRLPPKKKPGDPVLAADWNILLDAIAARTPRPGTGLEMIASSGGFAYSNPAPLSAPHAGLPPFSVIGIEKKDDSYQVTIKEGWVIERKPRLGDTPAVRFHIPKAGEKNLASIPRPQIGMAIGDTLWCKFSTDKMGEIKSDPEVFAASEDQAGGHYYPNDPEGPGSDGGYFVKLFKLEQEDGSPVVSVYQQSDIEHWAQLWTGENLGDGTRVFKEHKEDENIYKFRTIKRRESQHQINVVEDGDIIRVHGNNKDGSLKLEGGTSSEEPLLEWKDGLMTSEGEKKLLVKEYMVCDYGTPTLVKFVVVE
jgi:hypothetical protein